MMEYKISGNLNVFSIGYGIRLNFAPQQSHMDWEPSQSNGDDFDIHPLSLCEECGQDHDFKPTFDDVKTSIDTIPKLLEKIEAWGVGGRSIDC
jgi:hypothetical protein